MTINKRLLEYIDKSPTAFHAVDNLKKKLDAAGFAELKEEEKWNLEPSSGYYVIRNGSSIISFKTPAGKPAKFKLVASHSDSPSFKVKENPELKDDKYIRLNVEGYGGMIIGSWLDRPLSIAGRVLVYEDGEIKSKLINIDRDLLMIPSLAIHMEKTVNKGKELKIQKDIPPIIMEADNHKDFLQFIAEEIGAKAEDILGKDLFLYNRMKATVWGANGEYFSSGRIDNLECCYTSFAAFMDEEPGENTINMHVVFDNEEINSMTMQGADSTFLEEIMERASMAFGCTREEFMMQRAGSFMISADNAHALHPSYPDKADTLDRPAMNRGIVIKFNADQKYSTDGASGGEIVRLCRENHIPYQIFSNRADATGGSTLGNISQKHVSLKMADIGLAQLAMHSSYETAGTKDPDYMVKLAKAFYGNEKNAKNVEK